MFRPNRSVPSARVIETREPVHVVDLKDDPAYVDGDPLAVFFLAGCRICSLIAVPLLKEGAVVGAMTIYRREVLLFTDKQIALVSNFAAALIAIENAASGCSANCANRSTGRLRCHGGSERGHCVLARRT